MTVGHQGYIHKTNNYVGMHLSVGDKVMNSGSGSKLNILTQDRIFDLNYRTGAARLFVDYYEKHGGCPDFMEKANTSVPVP